MGSSAQKFRRKGEYVFRQIGSEGVLVPIRSGMSELSSVFTLNPVAAFIWRLTDSPRSIAEMAEAVHLQYEVSLEQSLFDTTEFVEVLCEKSLIEAYDATHLGSADV